MAGNTPVLKEDPHEAVEVSALFLSDERIAADEVVIPLHEPLTCTFQGRLAAVEVRAGEKESLLEPQGVPRAEADGDGIQVPTRRDGDRVPLVTSPTSRPPERTRHP